MKTVLGFKQKCPNTTIKKTRVQVYGNVDYVKKSIIERREKKSEEENANYLSFV